MRFHYVFVYYVPCGQVDGLRNPFDQQVVVWIPCIHNLFFLNISGEIVSTGQKIPPEGRNVLLDYTTVNSALRVSGTTALLPSAPTARLCREKLEVFHSRLRT